MRAAAEIRTAFIALRPLEPQMNADEHRWNGIAYSRAAISSRYDFLWTGPASVLEPSIHLRPSALICGFNLRDPTARPRAESTRATMARTDWSNWRRKMFGKTPMTKIRATRGARTVISRGVRSRRLRFSGLS